MRTLDGGHTDPLGSFVRASATAALARPQFEIGMAIRATEWRAREAEAVASTEQHAPITRHLGHSAGSSPSGVWDFKAELAKRGAAKRTVTTAGA